MDSYRGHHNNLIPPLDTLYEYAVRVLLPQIMNQILLSYYERNIFQNTSISFLLSATKLPANTNTAHVAIIAPENRPKL